MSYWIYKRFGRVIGQKEWDATIKLIYASWYEKPYYKFIVWKEKIKRWLGAEEKLPGDNPFKGCIYKLIIIIIISILVLIISYI